MSTTQAASGYVWLDIDRGPVTGTNWSRFLGSGKPIDPYMVWADMSRLAGFGGIDNTEHQWPLLIELAKADNDVPAQRTTAASCISTDKVAVVFGMLSIPGAYLNDTAELGPPKTITRFITARASPCNIEMLLMSNEIVRMQLGIPRLPKVDPEGLAVSVPTFDRRRKARTIIGIIDDGCAFAHPAFTNPAGEPRVWFLWDQDERRRPVPEPDPAKKKWRDFRGFGYGAELGYRALRSAVAQAADGDELAPYRYVDYVPVAPDPDRHATSLVIDAQRTLPAGTMLRATHGTGVMDLAAGAPPPRRMQSAVVDDALALPPGQADGSDRASAWPIVFVQLPTRTVLDTSGGSLGVHVLDGLRYILRRADMFPYEDAADGGGPPPMTPPPGGDLEDVKNSDKKFTQNDLNNLIINVSFGAIAGPHDGTSIIEDAMADIVHMRNGSGSGSRRLTWIVVAAGNSHRNGTHVRMQFGAGLAEHQLVWRVGPDNPAETYLEVWLPGVDVDDRPVHDTVRADFMIDVRAPGSMPPAKLRIGDGKLLFAPGDQGAPPTPVMGAVFARRVVQGRSGTMVLLAVGPTRRALLGAPQHRPAAPHGDWIVDVTLVDADQKRPMLVHAWAERNDLLFGLRRRQQAGVTAEVMVPEPTEFYPEALWFKRHFADGRGTWSGAEPPRPMQPDSAMGSLASVVPARPDFCAVPGEESDERDRFGSIVVAGAYRLADGEVSPYSSGGPARTSPDDADMSRMSRRPPGTVVDETIASESAVVYEAADGEVARKWRVRPDIDAPADVGMAMRGLRVAGLLPGSFTRISGTSAAAPQVTRLIANHSYADTWSLDKPRACDGEEAKPTSPVTDRSSATPQTDDRFRKGRQRVP